jgi:hypothetical protein
VELDYFFEDFGEDAEAGEVADDAEALGEDAVAVAPALLAVGLGQHEGEDLLLLGLHLVEARIGEAELRHGLHEARRVGEMELHVGRVLRCVGSRRGLDGVHPHHQHAIEQTLLLRHLRSPRRRHRIFIPFIANSISKQNVAARL